MADLNNDGLDDETGLPMNPHVNPTAAPFPKPKVEVPPTNTDDDWVKTNVTGPEDLELYNVMTPGEKEFVRTLPNTPGGREALQFIRSTPEDRAKIMSSFKEADKKAYETMGQGVKVTEPISQPLSEKTYSDTQTTEEEKAKLDNNKQTTTNTLDKVNAKLAELGERFENPKGANVSGSGSGSSTTNTPPTTTPPTTPTTTTNKPDNKTKGSYKLRSIMDAFNDGEIDKSTRDYLIVDTISKFARGLGKDISNIGAAYTGGAIQDSTPEETLWSARNKEMAKQGISSEANKVAGSDREQNYRGKEANIKAAELGNELTGYKLEVPRTYKKLIDNAENIEAPWLRAAVKGSAQAMLNNAVNGGELNPTTLITNIIANGGNELAQAAQADGKSPEQYVADTVKSMLPEVKASIF